MTLVTDFIPASGNHAGRPASATDGTLYSCTTHGLVYRYTTAGGWVTWATLAGTVLTTKGDLLTFDTALARLAAGTDGYVLTADSTQAKGVKWAAAAGGSSVPTNLALNLAYTITAGTVWSSYPDTAPPVEWFTGASGSGSYRTNSTMQKLTDGSKTGPYTGGNYTGILNTSADPVFAFDLAAAKTVSQVNVYGTGGAGGIDFPDGFVVDWSDDNSSWTNIYTDTGNTRPSTGADHNWTALLAFTGASHRYWRVKVTHAASTYIFLSEIEIMGY